ncbi:TPA: hypothetical protein DEA21_04255 [Candidatus Uhrbacteria bacterium]|nr:hypothetical protein [Candidatus Uhrbacteria bacterium]HCU32152.1 hypothetical protein [Candidatus Uhrbacteria bacterium]
MPRPTARPIIVRIETPESEPIQKRVAANGEHGLKETLEVILAVLCQATGAKTTEPRHVTIRTKDAPLLDPTTEIGDLRLPVHIDPIIDNIRFCAGRDVVHSIWHLAMLTKEWLRQNGNNIPAILALDLFLADYGLCLGMTREELPQGDDNPWNQEPYFSLPFAEGKE